MMLRNLHRSSPDTKVRRLSYRHELVLGIGLTVFAFVGGEFLISLNWLAYAISGVGIGIVFTTLLGLVGACFHMFRGVLVLVSAAGALGAARCGSADPSLGRVALQVM